MNIVAIVQARMSSSRLPGKIMLPVLGKPILAHQLERMRRSELLNKIVVATSKNTNDDIILELCEEIHIDCYRGSLDNLLDRHYKAALAFESDVALKIPSDCPLISHEIIDSTIRRFLESYPNIDYVSNLHPPSYPDGNDVEVFSMTALKRAWHESEKSFELEHTTPYIWENPGKFKIGNVKWDTGLDLSKKLRLTLDYLEDYQFIKAIYEELYPRNRAFTLNEILSLLHKKSFLLEINKKYLGEYWYKNHKSELRTINKYYPEYA